MFTGIVEEIGTLSLIERGASFCKLTISASKILDDCKEGDSVAVNGTCLTVTRLHTDSFVADAMAETMRRTNLENLKAGDKVNLERSLRPIDRLGGHIVAGHVDEVGKIIDLRQEDIATVATVRVSSPLMKYIAVKGSVCVDGVSLTVTDVGDAGFQVWLIPFTKENTTLGLKSVGDAVNIEVDMLARYVEKLISYRAGSSEESPYSIDQEFLKTHGFL
jgi:riboflavin synthase